MTRADDLQAAIQRLPGVLGAAVWKAGEVPVGDLGGRGGPAGPGLLSAGIGSLEHVIATIGLGQIEDMWFMTSDIQCLAVRSGAWQAVVIGHLDLDVDAVRDALADLLIDARAGDSPE